MTVMQYRAVQSRYDLTDNDLRKFLHGRNLSALDSDEWNTFLKNAERFGEQHGYRFRFSPGAVEAILAKSVEKNISARDLCEGLFKDYQFGLGLIHRNSGQTDFEIPAEAVESPDRVLSQWVVASHRTQDEHDENS